VVRRLDHRRLGRLEAKRKAPCEECGYSEDPRRATYELVFADPVLDDLEESDSKWCSACGRQLTHDIFFPDTSRTPRA
jgi:hypothetical protein